MLLKFLTNSPFLYLGAFVFLFAKLIAMVGEEPKDSKHTTGVVTHIWDPMNSSSYRAEVEFQLESGQTVRAKMLGLCSIADANKGDEIEIDYFKNKNGDYFASSTDPRYLSSGDRESNKKLSKVFYWVSLGFVVLYIVLTVSEFLR